jgi:predicted HTH domain antitoxin
MDGWMDLISQGLVIFGNFARLLSFWILDFEEIISAAAAAFALIH